MGFYGPCGEPQQGENNSGWNIPWASTLPMLAMPPGEFWELKGPRSETPTLGSPGGEKGLEELLDGGHRLSSPLVGAEAPLGEDLTWQAG